MKLKGLEVGYYIYAGAVEFLCMPLFKENLVEFLNEAKRVPNPKDQVKAI